MANANLRRTIYRLGYALITDVAENGKPTYGPVKWLASEEAGGREYSASPTGTANSIWADGKEVYASESNQGYDITLTTLSVCDDIEEDWYGSFVDEGFVEEYGGDIEYPHFALVIVEDTTDGTGETTIFYDCHITQRSQKTGKTAEGNGLDPQFPEHTISCRPRQDCGAIKIVKQQKTLITSIPEPSQAGPHIFIRESSAQITTTGSVQLHISSIYPADATVTWASSAEAKATVSAGLVTGAAAGKTNITASITEGGTTYSDTCAVTVVSAT